MQAIFLESGEKSCGTGVFLPQRGGTNCQPSRKPGTSLIHTSLNNLQEICIPPEFFAEGKLVENVFSACSPVLLPSRVVQALNLNVHAIGLQISPRKGSQSSSLLHFIIFLVQLLELITEHNHLFVCRFQS